MSKKELIWRPKPPYENGVVRISDNGKESFVEPGGILPANISKEFLKKHVTDIEVRDYSVMPSDETVEVVKNENATLKFRIEELEKKLKEKNSNDDLEALVKGSQHESVDKKGGNKK